MSINSFLIESTLQRDKKLDEASDNDSWLFSYVDLLLIMVTLFVLLLGFQKQPLNQALLKTAEAVTPIAQTKKVQSNHLFLDQIYLNDLEGRVSVKETGQQMSLTINDSILFLAGGITLSETGGQVIDELALMLRDKGWRILVEGHTDGVPIATARFPSNWELSSARATQVTRRLIARGISSQRLSAIGYADTRPLKPAENVKPADSRRVTLVLSAPEQALN